jgi:ketosteroid isomerase-like protein
MSAADVAKEFTEHLKAGDFEKAEAFWSKDVVSIEAADSPMKECRGLEAVKAKGAWWSENHDIHSFAAEGPFVNGDQFAIIFKIDVTRKADKQRTKMDEVALYTVKNDKIVEERFFY